MNNQHFAKGSGTYTCRSCGKLTRDTGHLESAFDLCWHCYQVEEQMNAYADGMISEAELDEALKKLEANHG